MNSGLDDGGDYPVKSTLLSGLTAVITTDRDNLLEAVRVKLNATINSADIIDVKFPISQITSTVVNGESTTAANTIFSIFYTINADPRVRYVHYSASATWGTLEPNNLKPW